MKIIFLDIDGVLSTTNESYWNFNIGCVERLKQILEYGYKIVISSTWKTLGITDDKSRLKQELTKHGLIEYLYMPDWSTPILIEDPSLWDYCATDSELKRPREISLYLQNHPEVENYLILDDDEWKFTDEQQRRVIKTDVLKGLQVKHIRRALEIEMDFEVGKAIVKTFFESKNGTR
jgi:hypothetical protein